MGYQLFTDPWSLFAADLNNLMRQSNIVYTSAAARATAIPSPNAGMVSILTDNAPAPRIQWHDGTAYRGVRSASFGVQGVAGTTSGLGSSPAMTTATLTVPDQGCSGRVMVWAQLLYDKSLRTDAYYVYINDSTAGITLSLWREPDASASWGMASLMSANTMAAGASKTLTLAIQRLNVTDPVGTATVYANYQHNRLDALFIPD